MISSFLSTQSIALTNLRSIEQTQRSLNDAQIELSTGRHSDLAATLGSRIGASVGLRQEQTHIQSIVDANAQVTVRIGGSQAALSAVATTAQDMLGYLVQSANDQTNAKILVDAARKGLAAIESAMNTTVDGVHLFSGINSDAPALNSYSTQPASAAQQQVATAFTTAFGVAQSDTAVANIPASSVQDFLDTSFSALFTQSQWASAWSQATTQVVQSRVSPRELVQTSVTANDPAIANIVKAFVMISDLGIDNMNSDARMKVIAAATSAISQGGTSVTIMQTQLGSASNTISSSNDRMAASSSLITQLLSGQEDVDATAVAAQVSNLTQKLETAYAIVSRLQKLSLVNSI